MVPAAPQVRKSCSSSSNTRQGAPVLDAVA